MFIYDCKEIYIGSANLTSTGVGMKNADKGSCTRFPLLGKYYKVLIRLIFEPAKHSFILPHFIQQLFFPI